MSDALRYKVAQGLSWSFIAQAGRQGLKTLIGIVLARLLVPEEFGLLSMVVAVTGFARLIAEFGFSIALIQKQDCTDKHLSSAFWFNLGSGFILMIIALVAAPLLARFYHEPILAPLTRVLAVDFVISALSVVQSSLLSKMLKFRALALIELLSVGVSGVIGVVLAWAGMGVWSLALQSLSFSATMTGLLWFSSSWYPKTAFSWIHLKDLLGFGANLLGAQILNYWTRNIDYVLVGHLFGSGDLGIYSRAYMLIMVPLISMSQVVSKVIFPSFSRIRDNRERIKGAFLRVVRSVAFVTFPLMCGLSVVAGKFVLLIFGPKWLPMVPILQVFCVVGMLQSISKLDGNLYYSMGRPDLQFKVGLVLKPLEILGIVVGLQWGILGVAVGYAIAVAVGIYPNFVIAGRLIGLRFIDIIKSLAGEFACSVIMAATVWCIGLITPGDWHVWWSLTFQVLVGVLVYWGEVYFLDLFAYRDIKAMVNGILQQILQDRLCRERQGL